MRGIVTFLSFVDNFIASIGIPDAVCYSYTCRPVWNGESIMENYIPCVEDFKFPMQSEPDS